MILRRSRPILTLLVLLGVGGVACGAPGPRARTPTLPTPSPTSAEAVIPATPIYPTETISEPPPSQEPEYEGLTWLASNFVRIGEPEEGWQTYRVMLAYENATDQFRNELASCDVWKPEIATQEGYVYSHKVEGWTAYCTWYGWLERTPWPEDCWYPATLRGVPTGVIPPGFRVRGAVGYNTLGRRACLAQITIEVNIGEALHPTTLTLHSGAIPPVPAEDFFGLEGPPPLSGNVISLGEVVQDFGLIDPSRPLESLPATISMGRAQVTIEGGVLRPDGLVAINLKYQNPDPAREVDIYNPVVAVIDSAGYLSAWGDVWGGSFPIRKFGEQCGDEISGELGPLQEADHHTCVVPRPGATVHERYFLVACGWTEDAEELDSGIGFDQSAGTLGSAIDPRHKECHVYELNMLESSSD